MKKTTAGMLLAIAASLQNVAPVPAKDKPAYDRGVVPQMDSMHRGFAERGQKNVAGGILGTDGQHKNTREVLCQGYILKSDRLIYRIHSRDEQHSTLLPVGKAAEFGIHKDKLLPRVPESEDKEREYLVVSMTRRADSGEARAAAAAQ